MKNKINGILVGLIVATTVLFMFLMLSNITAHRHQIEEGNFTASRELRVAATANRARLDINLCIVSVPPQTRTPEYVHKCYDDAEKQNNIKVQRFGYGQ